MVMVYDFTFFVLGRLAHQWLKYFFSNFEVKIRALVVLYVWTLGLKGYFDQMIFTTLGPPKTAGSLRDSQPLPWIVSYSIILSF